MKYLQISGIDEINALAQSAMVATLEALVLSGKMSREDALEFLDTHVAQYAAKDMPAWRRVFTRLKAESQVVVSKVLAEANE